MDTRNSTALLDFWFASRELDKPTLDSRMGAWFGDEPAFAAAVSERFAHMVDPALAGEYDDWATDAHGRLALILLLGEIPRQVYRDDKRALRGDRKALKLCEQGVAAKDYQHLNALEQLFFFMPLQRIESIRIQQTSVKIFASLANRASSTLRETFATVAHFAELRHDIIAEFGRFPHRDPMLGRTPAEDEHTAVPA